MKTLSEKPRLRHLLDHFSAVTDPREQWRVAYPLPEVLLLVVCGTIASCDDYDDIVDWGEAHLAFLRRFLAYFHGIPCADWLRTLMNRVDPEVFSTCFMSWVRETWPDAPKLVAIDGKTSRRSHDRGTGKQALHLVSAFATNERLVLGQEAVVDKSCEQNAIPTLLERLAAAGALEGALVTIDAIACNPTIADAITGNGADFVLAVRACREGEPAQSARRDRSLFRRHAGREPQGPRRHRQGPWPHRDAPLRRLARRLLDEIEPPLSGGAPGPKRRLCPCPRRPTHRLRRSVGSGARLARRAVAILLARRRIWSGSRRSAESLRMPGTRTGPSRSGSRRQRRQPGSPW